MNLINGEILTINYNYKKFLNINMNEGLFS